MITNTEFALMSGAAYESTRDVINQIPSPVNWLAENPKTESSGFEAVAFIREGTTLATSSEIVISFAGTNPADISGDIAADLALAAGSLSAQLLQAADYYLQIRAINPDATISFTGHSLGGGLAALMAVFFDNNAATFDGIIGDRPRFLIVSTPHPSQSLDHASTPPTGPARRSAAPYPAR